MKRTALYFLVIALVLLAVLSTVAAIAGFVMSNFPTPVILAESSVCVLILAAIVLGAIKVTTNILSK